MHDLDSLCEGVYPKQHSTHMYAPGPKLRGLSFRRSMWRGRAGGKGGLEGRTEEGVWLDG